MLHIAFLQHETYEAPGVLWDWATQAGDAQVYSAQADLLALAQRLPKLDLLIVLGGPMGVADAPRLPWLQAELELLDRALQQPSLRLLGICLGAQLLADVLGGTVAPGANGPEIGWWPVETTPHYPVNWPLPPTHFPCLHWHSDTYTLPTDALQLLSSAAYPQQAFRLGWRILAFQCHPEVTPPVLEGFLANTPPAELTGKGWVQTPEQLQAGSPNAQPWNAWLCSLLDTWLALR
jgi:GMP synthase-like glutamine amidotransferase